MRCGLQLIALALFAGCGAGREQRVAVSAPMPVIVASFHKSLTGLMQTSIVLVQDERIDMGAPAARARRLRDDEHVVAARSVDGRGPPGRWPCTARS
jgi:hypothetical protein